MWPVVLAAALGLLGVLVVVAVDRRRRAPHWRPERRGCSSAVTVVLPNGDWAWVECRRHGRRGWHQNSDVRWRGRYERGRP